MKNIDIYIKNRLCLFILLCFIVCPRLQLLAQGRTLQTVKEDSNKVNFLLELARSYDYSKPDTIFLLYHQALQLAEKLKMKSKMAFIYNELGSWANMHQKIKESLEYDLKALKIYEELGDKSKIAKALLYIGGTYHSEGEVKLGLNYINKSLKIYQEIGDKKGMAEVYGMLGMFDFSKPATHQKGLGYLDKAMNIYKELKDTVAIADLLNYYLTAYNALGNEKEALKYGFMLLELSKGEDNRNTYTANYNIANAYMKSKKYKEAIRLFEKILTMKYRQGGLEHTYWTLAQIYIEINDYEKAEKYASKALAGIKKLTQKFIIKGIYETLCQINEKKGNYQQALVYYKLSALYQDSINQDYNKAEVKKLQFDFEMDKKQKEISLLEKDKQLEQEEKERQQLANILLVVSLVLTLLIGLLIYRDRQAKNKQALAQKEMEKALIAKEQELKLKYEKDRISKDLHDNIGSQLTLLSKNLDRLKRQPEGGKIENLSEMTQNIMQDLRSMIWVINKEEITGEELEEKITNLLWKTVGQLEGVFYEVKVDFQQEMSLTASQSLNLFRITQEALQNAIKYSRAQNIEIQISTDTSGQLFLKIIDDGVGFDLAQAQYKKGHYGLKNMASRAEEIGGIFKVETEVGRGTKIEVCLFTELA